MDIRQLEIFLAVARLSSFTQAAHSLAVAQPAISQSIAKLEEELGLPLFDRSGRVVKLTEAGNRLIPHAERVLADIQSARQEIARMRGMASGRISVGTTPTVATHLLPSVLATYRHRYPDVDVVLREGGASVLISMIERGAVDIGIVVMPIEHQGFEIVPLFTEPLLLAVSSQSALAAAAEDQPISLRLAADEPFILYRVSYHLRSATLNGCRAVGFEPRIALEGGEMETVLRMVAAGLGVSLVPQLALMGLPRPGIRALRVNDPPLSRTVALARRPERYLTPATESFIATLREVVATLVQTD